MFQRKLCSRVRTVWVGGKLRDLRNIRFILYWCVLRNRSELLLVVWHVIFKQTNCWMVDDWNLRNFRRLTSPRRCWQKVWHKIDIRDKFRSFIEGYFSESQWDWAAGSAISGHEQWFPRIYHPHKGTESEKIWKTKIFDLVFLYAMALPFNKTVWHWVCTVVCYFSYCCSNIHIVFRNEILVWK